MVITATKQFSTVIEEKKRKWSMILPGNKMEELLLHSRVMGNVTILHVGDRSRTFTMLIMMSFLTNFSDAQHPIFFSSLPNEKFNFLSVP